MRIKRKRVLPIVLVIILASWVGNIWYYQDMQLSEPLFLNHNITIKGGQGERLELLFLENNNAAQRVTGVQIEQLQQLRFDIYEKTQYTHQRLMAAIADWEPDQTPIEPLVDEEPFTINEVMVFYSEGPPRRVPIGDINVIWRSGVGLTSFMQSSGSTNGNGNYMVKLSESATLTKVDYSYREKLKSWFQLELSGKPVESLIYPLKLSKGEVLSFEYQWLIPDSEPAATEVYSQKIILHFQTEDGRTVIESIPTNHNPNWSERQIKNLVRSGGKLQ